MADIVTNTLQIGSNNLVLRDADAQAKLATNTQQIATNTADITQLKEDLSVVQTDLSDAQTELEKKANIDGYYENMTVGDAEQLISTVYTEDSVPYNFRPTAGDGDRAYVDAVVGGTVALNQLLQPMSAGTTNRGVTVTVNSDGSITLNGTATESGAIAQFPSISTVAGHKYALLIDGAKILGQGYTDISSARTFVNNIIAETTTGNKSVAVRTDSGTEYSNAKMWFMVFDLTATFGTTIADYVYGLEAATAGAGVAWLKANAPKIFNAGYIQYNPGNLVSVSGVSEKRNTGFNQWDEQWEQGSISLSNGAETVSTEHIRSKNFCRCIPNTAYYVGNINSEKNIIIVWYDNEYRFITYNYKGIQTSPKNAHYFKLRSNGANDFTMYANNWCINLSDPARNGEYEPYEEHTYPLDSSLTIRGIPKLKDGKLYFDGDRYLPSGQVNRRYGIVDLGTLTWNYDSSSSQRWQTTTISSVIKNYSTRSANIVSDKWVADTSAVGGENGKMFTISGYIFCYSTDGVNKPTGTLLFELATPTTETAEPYQQRQIIDADGTEEFVSTSIVPVGHNTRYVPNLRAKLEKSPDSPASDGVYIVQRSNGVNTYVPLASSTTIQDILNRLTALEGA